MEKKSNSTENNKNNSFETINKVTIEDGSNFRFI